MDLPVAIGAYFSADTSNDESLVARCFTDDGVVHDEDDDYHGPEAIGEWSRVAHEKYSYKAEPLDFVEEGHTVRLRALVTGSFPGSPVELDYTFTLSSDKIARLDIS